MERMACGIYLHIPFCGRRCPYCDFNTYTGMESLIPDYMQAVRAELQLHAAQEPNPAGEPLRSIYFGGGTPSLLPPNEVGRTLESIHKLYGIDDQTEISFEVNPGTVDGARLSAYRKLGITRLSLGSQSFRDEQLAVLGRDHSVAQTRETIEQALKCDFRSLSVDLMYGVTGQQLCHWRADLEQALSCGAEHLSLYNLTIEEGTPYARLRAEGKLPLPNEGLLRDMYISALEETSARGFERYEVSNFARTDHSCRHNRLYWEGRGWLGLGAGAHGFTAKGGAAGLGRRWWNLRLPRKYMSAVKTGHLPWAGSEDLDLRAAIDEELLLSLRTRRGLRRERFAERFGFDPAVLLKNSLKELSEEALIQVDSQAIRVSEDSVIITDYAVQRVASLFDRRSVWAIVSQHAEPRRAG